MQKFNILYWGPEGAGKSTSMLYLNKFCTKKGKHEIKEIAQTSIEQISLEVPKTDQGPIQIVLETVSGSEKARHTRETLLKQAEGVIFVFDCTLTPEANLQSFSELKTQLQRQRRTLATFPLVYQFNKQDVFEKANFAEWLDFFPLNPYSISIATNGSGVFPTFVHLIRLLFLQKRQSLTTAKINGQA